MQRERKRGLLQARMAACKLELMKLRDFKLPAYRGMWNIMLDHYQNTLLLEREAEGKSWFYIITGKRWLPKQMLLYYLQFKPRTLLGLLMLMALSVWLAWLIISSMWSSFA